MNNTNNSKYIQRVLDGELEELRKAEGGRNNALFRVATRLFQFVEGGSLTEDYVFTILTDESSSLGLAKHEIYTTLKSARAKVLGKPANVPIVGVQQQTFSTPDPAVAPSDAWQSTAAMFMKWSFENLWAKENDKALDYMLHRKISEEIVMKYGLGYNPKTMYRSRSKWGLAEDESTTLVIPEGIVIPYYVDGKIWKIEIRSIEGKNKHTIAGSSNSVWGLDYLNRNKPVMLTEGVINGLTIAQFAKGNVQPIALGAITHGRKIKFMSKLSALPVVLISTDADVAGEAGANWWKEILAHNSVRWRPLFGDINDMAMKEQDITAWIESGLDFAYSSLFNNE